MKAHKFLLMINGGEYYSVFTVSAKEISFSWSDEEKKHSKLEWNCHLDGDQINADGTLIKFGSAFEYHGEDK